jgi:GNAT superfamily N-acetyltransferase
LFEAAGDWLCKSGMEAMRGPMNYCTHQVCGLLVDGFDSPPVILMPYNPPYYEALIERYGFSKALDLYAYTMEAHNPPDYLVRVADEVAKNPDLKIRTIDLGRREEELQYLKKIYNSAWSRNWGFVPLTKTEFEHIAKRLCRAIDPDLFFIAEVKGEPVGLAINLPDYNIPLRHMHGRLFPAGWLKFLWYRRKIDMLRVYALGVLPSYHDLRLGALLYVETWKAALKKGYKSGEMSWIFENNKPMNRALQWMGARVYKTYRIYDRPL